MRALLPLLLLAGCDGDDSASSKPPSGWLIGPVINGTNYSKDCPRSFTGSFQIGPCEPHYVTRATAPLTGKTIRLRYRLEGNVEGLKCNPATISLHFQRKGDDWSGKGAKEAYRWWSATQPLQQGEHELVAGKWTAVQGSNSDDQAEAFRDALANAERVGFTFGDCTGLGHGVKGQARFTVLEFAA